MHMGLEDRTIWSWSELMKNNVLAMAIRRTYIVIQKIVGENPYQHLNLNQLRISWKKIFVVSHKKICNCQVHICASCPSFAQFRQETLWTLNFRHSRVRFGNILSSLHISCACFQEPIRRIFRTRSSSVSTRTMRAICSAMTSFHMHIFIFIPDFKSHSFLIVRTISQQVLRYGHNFF